MLDESCKRLSEIKASVPTPEFESMEFRHNQLYLMVVDAKSDIRGRERKQVFFANTAEKNEFYVQARQLLTRCQIHHNDALKVSRRASQRNSQLQVAGSSSSISPAPASTTQEDGFHTKWLSIGSASASDLSRSKAVLLSRSQSDSEPSGRSPQFIATVVHIPRSALATEDELQAQLPDDDSYYRILPCGNNQKRAVVVDTKSYPISANYDASGAKRSQDKILRVGDMLMQSDPERLKGHQVVESYRGPSFISFISFWDYNSLPLGGMA
ncbi:hypothetical protein B0J17DRAFT_771421 [Rhizoctonia solani]|nr:hypothetical protein B0J17DRAFT_771421 [Rhizoctonia solani]